MKFKSIADNEVFVTYDEDETRKFWAPQDGGYVRDTTHKPGTTGYQITENGGHCLEWNPNKGPLIHTIRKWAKKNDTRH